MIMLFSFCRFKDHKRCSHMIANALDADGIFTAAQVSRKLKQLGLRVSQQKRSEGNIHLRDVDLINSSDESSEDSDNETLISLIKRYLPVLSKFMLRNLKGSLVKVFQQAQSLHLLEQRSVIFIHGSSCVYMVISEL